MPAKASLGVGHKIENGFIEIPIAIIFLYVLKINLWRHNYKHSKYYGHKSLLNRSLANCLLVRFPKAMYVPAPEIKSNKGILKKCNHTIQYWKLTVVSLFFTCQSHSLNHMPV